MIRLILLIAAFGFVAQNSAAGTTPPNDDRGQAPVRMEAIYGALLPGEPPSRAHSGVDIDGPPDSTASSSPAELARRDAFYGSLPLGDRPSRISSTTSDGNAQRLGSDFSLRMRENTPAEQVPQPHFESASPVDTGRGFTESEQALIINDSLDLRVLGDEERQAAVLRLAASHRTNVIVYYNKKRDFEEKNRVTLPGVNRFVYLTICATGGTSWRFSE